MLLCADVAGSESGDSPPAFSFFSFSLLSFSSVVEPVGEGAGSIEGEVIVGRAGI